jgi:hypothetical protein
LTPKKLQIDGRVLLDGSGMLQLSNVLKNRVVQLGVRKDNGGAVDVYDSDGKWKAGLNVSPSKPETPAKQKNQAPPR